MDYSQYIDDNYLIEVFSPIIAIGDVNTTARGLPVAGGFRITNEMLANLKLQGTSMAVARLRKYYAYPLESVPGKNTNISEWDALDRGIVLNYLLSSTILTIANITLVSTGDLKVKSIVELYTKEVERCEELLFSLDQNFGQVFPSLPGLKWAEYYINREQNPGIKIANPNTRYTLGSSISSLMYQGLFL